MTVTPYLGIPYVLGGRSISGADCYGLVGVVLRDAAGIGLAEVGAYDADTAEAIPRLFDQGIHSPEWVPVPLKDHRALDVIHFELVGIPMHCGIIVEPGVVLHTLKSRASHTIRLESRRWARRVHGCYRHRALVDSRNKEAVPA